MRYWHPLTEAAARELRAAHPDEIVLLPLYPQYSISTTGSSFHEWDRCYNGDAVPVRRIRQYHDHPLLIDAFVEKIAVSLRHFRRAPHRHSADVHLVFSAHGVPVSFIKRGDPYQQQVEETVRLVRARGLQAIGPQDWPVHSTLCYQSKVGKQRWLEPSLVDTLRALGAAGVPRVLAVPIAFVSEHVETLHEINQEARAIAVQSGVRQFAMVPALGDSPLFIGALCRLVLDALKT
jgi:ferrochelatase